MASLHRFIWPRRFVFPNLLLYSTSHGTPFASPTLNARASAALPVKTPIANVKHVLAVASGKGGVGKSTTAVNLAMALSNLKRKVGILDADIYGPSIPKLMNLENLHPRIVDDTKVLPLTNYAIECMSMGFLSNSAIVWRGLMVMKALEQLIRDVKWSPLDYLIIDMPPGTGDTQLTITQRVPLSGVVLVTTPQDVALIDAQKGAMMFKQVAVPVLGVIENMSYFKCPHCLTNSKIFNGGNVRGNISGIEKLLKEFNIPLLASVPLDPIICETSDIGQPVVLSHPQSAFADAYMQGARAIIERIESSL